MVTTDRTSSMTALYLFVCPSLCFSLSLFFSACIPVSVSLSLSLSYCHSRVCSSMEKLGSNRYQHSVEYFTKDYSTFEVIGLSDISCILH